MPAYTPPSLDAVDFALGTFTPASVAPYELELASIVPPALDAADFALVAYTQPTFNSIEFDLDAAFTPDAPPDSGGGGESNAGKLFIPDAIIAPAVTSGIVAKSVRPISVIDKTGRLSKDPSQWPDGLKQAIAECCCSQSSVAPKEANPCCPGLVLPETIQGNIRNTKIHDTGLNMRFWPNVLIKFGDGFNQFPEETYPPWIPREAMPFLYTNSGFGAPNIYVFRWGGVWYSDFIEDYECNYDLNGYFFTSLGGINTIQIDYHIQMNVKVYYYVTYGLTTINDTSLSGVVGAMKTGCGLRVWQCAYPTGTITFSNQQGANVGFLLPVPNPLPITYLLNNGGPGVINAFRSLFNYQSQTSVVSNAGSNGVLYNAVTGKYTTGQAPFCTDYEPLVCKPFSRTHVFQGYQIGAPGIGLDYPTGIFAQCLDLKANIGNNAAPIGYGVPGTALANPDNFGNPQPDDLENFVRCDKAAIDFNTDPFMEVFS